MENPQWSSAVRLEFGGQRSRVVFDTVEAAQVLMGEWPTDTGVSLTAAKRACLAALEGKQPAESARAAFLKAAKEAGLKALDTGKDLARFPQLYKVIYGHRQTGR